MVAVKVMGQNQEMGTCARSTRLGPACQSYKAILPFSLEHYNQAYPLC